MINSIVVRFAKFYWRFVLGFFGFYYIPLLMHNDDALQCDHLQWLECNLLK